MDTRHQSVLGMAATKAWYTGDEQIEYSLVLPDRVISVCNLILTSCQSQRVTPGKSIQW